MQVYLKESLWYFPVITNTSNKTLLCTKKPPLLSLYNFTIQLLCQLFPCECNLSKSLLHTHHHSRRKSFSSPETVFDAIQQLRTHSRPHIFSLCTLFSLYLALFLNTHPHPHSLAFSFSVQSTIYYHHHLQYHFQNGSAPVNFTSPQTYFFNPFFYFIPTTWFFLFSSLLIPHPKNSNNIKFLLFFFGLALPVFFGL